MMSSDATSTTDRHNRNDNESSAATSRNDRRTTTSKESKSKSSFIDHYSIGKSTELRFRGSSSRKNNSCGRSSSRLRVIDDVGRDQQLVIIEQQMQTQTLQDEQRQEGTNAGTSPSSSTFTTSSSPGTTTTMTTMSIQLNVTGTFGTSLLRLLYVFVSFFILTILFAFVIQTILFLFMNVVGTYSSEEWTSEPPVLNLIGCILACPLLLYGLASFMIMSWSFTVDCWRGISTHPTSLLRNVFILLPNFYGCFDPMIVLEWIVLTIFIGLPVLTAAILLLSGNDKWKDYTLLVWSSSVFVFQCLYMTICHYTELNMCYQLLKKYKKRNNNDGLIELIKINLLLTQRQKYSGIQRERYLIEQGGSSSSSNSNLYYDRRCNTSYSLNKKYIPVQMKYSFGTRLTKLLSFCYDMLEDDDGEKEAQATITSTVNADRIDIDVDNGDEADPTTITTTTTATTTIVNNNDKRQKLKKRNYTIDEVCGNVTISTKNNWNLERLWCVSSKRTTSLTIKEGEGSVSQSQLTSAYWCYGIAMVLIILLVAGFLQYKETSIVRTISIVIVVSVVCFVPMIRSLYHVAYKFHHIGDGSGADGVINAGVINDNNDDDDEEMNVVAVSSSSNNGEHDDRDANNASKADPVTKERLAAVATKAPATATNDDHDNIDIDIDIDNDNDNDDVNDDDNNCCEAFVSIWESVRVTELKTLWCYIFLAIEIIVFFLWPVISLFYFQNTPIGVVFLVLGIQFIPTHYFNVSNLLQDQYQHQDNDIHNIGGGTCRTINDLDLNDVDLSPLNICSSSSSFRCLLGGSGGSGGNSNGDNEVVSDNNMIQIQNRDIKNKSLIANMVLRVTRSRASSGWIGVFGLVYFVLGIAFYLASTEDTMGYIMGRYKWKGVVYADGFYWDGSPQLPYPTCRVEQKGFGVVDNNGSGVSNDIDYVSLASFAFLSTLSFSSVEESQPLLDQWFGKNVVIDDNDYVSSYRKFTGTEDHPVTYKLFTIPQYPDSAIISIRGSETMWDWAVDGQLWAGSVLAKIIINVNPLGYIWEPIMDEVVVCINIVQSRKLKEVSYYQYTSRFVETLYNGYDGRAYKNIRVTGASLGGGLAILTGAITGASAIAISGLNAMYSRRTFLPPITEEQLNTRVFNTIPERDIIAHIDKPGMLYQQMQCRGPKNSLFACHSMFRSLCEIQYQCGSHGKPINCYCVSKYGYPEPIQNGTKTWEETCSEASTPPPGDT